jgi:hypothetical protein
VKPVVVFKTHGRVLDRVLQHEQSDQSDGKEDDGSGDHVFGLLVYVALRLERIKSSLSV